MRCIIKTGYGSFIILCLSTIALASVYNHDFAVRPYKTETAPRIDGILDDPAWQYSVIDTLFISYNPAYGDTLPMRTKIHMTYDSENLYYAFECFDTEPDKIKTSISQRDRIFSDDWIGFSLDALGNKQATYDFFVNPNGIQGDILSTANSEDSAPDWVWESAGQLVESGYQVEVRIPLKSIRYVSGKRSLMGILFWRKISRLGMSGAFPRIEPGQSSLAKNLPVLYENLAHPKNAEILPSATYSAKTERRTPEQWGNAWTQSDFGLSLKYSVTSSMTAEATYNPDFSQVESDAFQVEVNQRYPIFFSEKRPFFMEAGGLFNVAATGGDNNMWTAVHTRKIVDPEWGGRITGALDRTSFGVLAAQDAFPGRELEEKVNPFTGKHAAFTIARIKHALSGDNYIGAIYSGRELMDGYNRVLGVDMSYRAWKSHNFGATFLQSYSREPDSLKQRTHGHSAILNYFYGSKKLGIWSSLERFEPNFDMQTAFYMRTGFNRGQLYFGPNFYLSEKWNKWVKRINPFIFSYYLHDLATRKNDILIVSSLRTLWTRQGMLRLDYIFLQEYWKTATFDQRLGRVMANAQATNWLNFNGRISYGKTIYYDSDTPYLGNDFSYDLGLTLQPNTRYTQSFDFYHETFKDPATGQIKYNLNILNSRTTYQFNKYFFLRAVLRYQDYDKRLLTDFLASFTFIPGTVVHLGYGALYERRDWVMDEWLDNEGRYYETNRSLFVKASYLWRL